MKLLSVAIFFFSSRRRHTRFDCDWSSDVCSSDLAGNPLAVFTDGDGLSEDEMLVIAREMNLSETVFVQKPTDEEALARLRIFTRSEEHTSELQSQSNLVCRLLLEKKKKTQNSIAE